MRTLRTGLDPDKARARHVDRQRVMPAIPLHPGVFACRFWDSPRRIEWHADDAPKTQRIEHEITGAIGRAAQQQLGQVAGRIGNEFFDPFIDFADCFCGGPFAQELDVAFQFSSRHRAVRYPVRPPRQHGAYGRQPLSIVESRPTPQVSGEAADGIFFFSGDRLKQIRGEVFTRFVGRVPRGIAGLLEEFRKGHETSQHGSIVVNPPQVFEKRGFDLGPARQGDGRDVVVVHRLRHAVAKPQKTECGIGGQRDPRPGIDRRAARPLPAELAVFGIGINPVVEHDVQGTQKTRFFEQLRQLGKDPEPPPPPDAGRAAKQAARRALEKLIELPHNRR